MDFLFGGKRDSRARDRGNYWQKSCHYGDTTRGCTDVRDSGLIRKRGSPAMLPMHTKVVGSGSQSRSAQPPPTSTVPTAPTCPIDEDYDEGVAETLIGLASYRALADSDMHNAQTKPSRRGLGVIRSLRRCRIHGLRKLVSRCSLCCLWRC